MAFPNVKRILKIGSPLSIYKLLLMAATFSRPKYRALWLGLLWPFVRQGEIALRYRCYNRYLDILVRMSDLESDYLSTLELGVLDVYEIDRGFHPNLVIDGGGNIGLFTLRAASAATSVGDDAVRFVICEPLPANVEQIKKNLARNGVNARILPACLGGTDRTIPFYCREANQSSFDSSKPYTNVMEIPVLLLSDAIGPDPAERILIKLDIEGMEVEALSSFVPSETRAVYIVGELHEFSKNSSRMEQIFADHGWMIEFHGTFDDLSGFRACSPAALPLLQSMGSKVHQEV